MQSVEVTQSLEERAEGETGRREPCLCETYARVTEGAAVAAARWLGSGDEESAEGAAVRAMRAALDEMPIRGRVVIGASEDTERLAIGEELGRGGDAFDLAVHPLEGRGVVAAGGRIKLIQDGDVTASISAAIRGTNDHLSVGIGGTRQAVISAAALRCLGGEIQAQLWPTTRTEIEQARAQGIDDVNRVFTLDDLAPGETIVAATGVSNGDLLRGVQFFADSARTRSLVMCTQCNWVRFVDGIHFFARERREEVRLPGV